MKGLAAALWYGFFGVGAVFVGLGLLGLVVIVAVALDWLRGAGDE